jgi:hypothetical protein
VRRLALALLVALLPLPTLGHVTSTGLAMVEVADDRLSYKLTLVGSEVDEHYAPILQAAANGDRAAAERVAQAMRDYARFSIAGEACKPGRIGVQGSNTGDGKIVMQMALSCGRSSGTLWIRDDWPEVLGAHFQTVMTVSVVGRTAGQFVFLDDRREATMPMNANGDVGWLSFIAMGAEHILGGLDHLLFLVALLALSRSLWTTVTIVTGFTVAHSITLSLAVLGVVDVPSRIVEPLIAASIVWVALENVLAPAGIGRRWLVAALFGLVHGLGFAGGLLELGMPRDALVRALIGFNVGVEFGQILFVAVVLPAIVWASRPGRLPRLPQALSIAVAAIGTMWFLERVFLSP